MQRAGDNLGQAKYAADHLKATGGISRIGEPPSPDPMHTLPCIHLEDSWDP